MATEVYKTKDITLQDGTEVTLKPAVIGRLRRLMNAWSKFDKVENDDDGFDVFVNCCGIGLEENFVDQFGGLEFLQASAADKKKDVYLSKEYKEYLENVLDLETIYTIMDVCGGIKLNDPKLLEAAQAAMLTETQE